MCGIAGFISPNGRLGDRKDLEKMLDRLFHRGPDSFGVHIEAPAFLGMRRLSINDLEHGHQPLSNESGSIKVFYNGEIYNHSGIRSRLRERGHKLTSHSDGEVIAHLYEESGAGFLSQLDGMFAIALWDSKKKKLLLARDFPGEKPLYYCALPDGGIAFASELKALEALPGLDFTLSPQALWDMPSFLWVPEPSTVYQNISAIPPGHYLEWSAGGIKVSPYGNGFPVSMPEGSQERRIETIREVVTRSIESRLLSDVPVGSFLSGGLDSSIIATVAAKKMQRLHTFTIGFEDVDDPYHGRADEAADAESYARALGTDHCTIRVGADDFQAELEVFASAGDQPFSVSSGLGILFVAKAARERGVKVLLSGDGADECFGGYSWYSQLPLLRALIDSSGKREAVPISVTNQAVGLPVEERLRAFSQYGSADLARALHYYATESDKMRLFSQDLAGAVRTSSRYFDGLPENWRSEDVIAHDRAFYFPNEMLRKVDRMTMAYSVEGRAPFAAPEILSLASQLRMDEMLKGRTLKWALREAFAGIVPSFVLERPKHGFNVPIDHWLRGSWAPLLERSLGPGSKLAKVGILHPRALENARSMLGRADCLSGHTIFSLIMMNLWMEVRK